jgi:hypothetical protein
VGLGGNRVLPVLTQSLATLATDENGQFQLGVASGTVAGKDRRN